MKILNGLATGQVLQRLGRKGATLRLAGTCPENGPIEATIRDGNKTLKGWKAKRVGQSARKKFKVELSGIPAGGPYRLDLRCGKAKATVQSFYVGDVWVLAGQSNMQGCGEISGAAKPHPLIRAFSMRREWRLATEPLHVLGESPDACHNGGCQFTPAEAEKERRTVRTGVGAGLFFAREMLKKSGVPQALICVAHGGTSMPQWDPALKGQGGASLYASMLLSVHATHQPVAGVLWYQGESDAILKDTALYPKRMKNLVAATRRDLGQPALPWIVVQLSRYLSALDTVASWNLVQDQQRLLPNAIKNLETVSAIDLPLDDSIHIGAAGFPRLTTRLAWAADRMVYGNTRAKRSPRLKSITGPFQKPKELGYCVDVTFDHLVGGLKAAGEPYGFELTDENNMALPGIYKIELKGDTARLHLTAKPDFNTRLSYGHGHAPYCNVTDGADRALLVFGPIRFSKPEAYLPFVRVWKATGIVSSAEPLGQIACPDPDAFGATAKTYGADGFIDEHLAWNGKPGQSYFACRLDLPEPMSLQFLMAYDGPFRLWLDGEPFFDDLNGTNPCVVDSSNKTASLSSGPHQITVAMDLNGGRAWGFFLRFRRVDLTRPQINARDYAVPVYLV